MTACDVQYEVRYSIRGSAPSVSPATLANVEWGRRLDDISKAKISHVLSGPECCGDMRRLEPWADTVSVYEDGILVWHGWITAVEYGFSSVVVEAEDALVWARYRALSEPYNANADSAEHFLALWNSAMAPSPIPVNVLTYLTGVVEQRKYETASHRRALWFILKEMMDSSLDLTVLGNTIHAGVLALASPINLTSEDFTGDITIRKDGKLYANQVLAEGARDTSAQFPEGVVSGIGIYPLVQDIVYDESIQNEASLLALAKSRYEYSSGIVPRVVRASDALTLKDGAVSMNSLVPGTIVNLETISLCFNQKQQFKLGNVDVTYGGGVRKVSISLQPVGTYAQLSEITADDDSTGTAVA